MRQNNTYVEKLTKNFRVLSNLKTKLDLTLSPFTADQRQELMRFSESIAQIQFKVNYFVTTPDGSLGEQQFVPNTTYQAFSEVNENWEKLIKFAHLIDEFVDEITKEIKEEIIFAKDNLAIRDLPKDKIQDLFDLIGGEKLEQITDLASELEVAINSIPILRLLWNQDLELFMKSKDLKDKEVEIESQKFAFEKSLEAKDDEIKKLKSKTSKEIGEDFSEQYKKIREEFETETRFCLGSKKFSKQEQSYKKGFLEKINPLYLIKKLWEKILKLFFNLSLKIFFLRLITYIIPIFLILFHFCELFGSNAKCTACSLFAVESSISNEKAKTDQNRDFRSQSSSNNSYLYFHLSLITILLLAFQQLRSTVREMNIKKSLIEFYRHRELVARNFTKMRNVVDGPEKSEVVKSAAKALFENEPIIHQSSSNLPPKAFDINLLNK